MQLTGQGACGLEQTLGARTTEVCITIPGSLCGPHRDFQVLVRRHRSHQLMTSVAFGRVDLESIVGNLNVSSCEVFAVHSGEQIICSRLHDQLSQVGFRVRLEVQAEEHGRFLEQLGETMSAELRATDDTGKPLAIWRQPVGFKGRTFEWRQVVGPPSSFFNNQPREFTFWFRVGPTVVATNKFQIVSQAVCLREAADRVKRNVTPTGFQITAVNHRSTIVSAEVIAEDFRELILKLNLSSPRPGDLVSEVEMPLGVTLRRCENGKTVFQRQRPVIIQAGSQFLQEAIAITPDLFHAGPGPYCVELLLENRALARAEFIHKTRKQLRSERAEAILQTVNLSDLVLRSLRDGRRVETKHVYETDEAIAPTFAIRAAGFDEETAVLKWRLNIALVNLETDRVFRWYRWLEIKEGLNECGKVLLPVRGPGWFLKPGTYCLRFFKRKQLLAERQFRILGNAQAIAYAARLIVDSVQAKGTRLFLQAGNGRYESSLVPDSTDLLLPELTIHAQGFYSQLPQVHTSLRVVLFQAHGTGAELVSWPIMLSEAPLHVKNLAIRIGDSPLGTIRGPCQLGFIVQDREIVRLDFEMVGEPDVIDALAVTSVKMDVVTQTGRRRKHVRQVRPTECRHFSFVVEFKIGILAPNVRIPVETRLSIDDDALGAAQLDLQLDRLAHQMQSKPIEGGCLNGYSIYEPHTLTLEVWINAACKATASFEIMCERITDFEGALNVDPQTLVVDDSEYQQILEGLS